MYFKSNLKIEKGRLDITPLIDVVFQLIIFFMLSSSFVLQPGIRVELPKVHSPGAEKPAGVSVTIRRDGRIFLNDREVKLEELALNLQKEKAVRKDDLLIIKADQKTLHGTVVQVMGIARRLGMTRLEIATKPDLSGEDGSDALWNKK